MLEVIISLVLPILLILFFTRVTYSKLVSLVLTVVLMFVAFDGLSRSIWVQLAGLVGVLLGFYLSKKPFKKTGRKWK
jgi:general stress protein CsbA